MAAKLEIISILSKFSATFFKNGEKKAFRLALFGGGGTVWMQRWWGGGEGRLAGEVGHCGGDDDVGAALGDEGPVAGVGAVGGLIVDVDVEVSVSGAGVHELVVAGVVGVDAIPVGAVGVVAVVDVLQHPV